MSLRAESAKGHRGAVAPGGPPAAHEASVLPLRLSVDRGALSIELTRPHATGGLVVEALDVHLDGVGFPVDLSRGVKQFRNHRGSLRRLQVRLDLEILGRYLEAAAPDVLGEPVLGVRVMPVALTDAGSSSPEARIGAGNDARAPALGMVAVSIYGARRALAFDLVLAPGSPPAFVVDGARGIFLEQPALLAALTLIERTLSRGPFDVARKGRTVELAGLARALLAEVLPGLGFRMPRLGGHVVHRAVFGPEGVSLLISSEEEPCPVGARAIRLAGLAAFTREADDCLASLDLEGARARFLDVLERVPGHAEVLLNLAEIDGVTPHRSESALAFLEEARRGPGQLDSRAALLAHRALGQGLRRDLAVEALEQALDLEADGTIAALCHCAIAVSSADPVRARIALDAAVSRAPSHPEPRWLRLERNLHAGAWSKGLVDAQQLEAMAAPGAQRAEVAARVGRLLTQHGEPRDAVIWLRRALVSSPDDAGILLDLAKALDGLGEGLRAAELYQMALVRVEGRLDAGSTPSTRELELDAARLALGRLLASETGDLPLALGYLRQVGSRSKEALSARELEIALARQLGDTSAVRSAALRLVQGLELGWIVSERAPLVLAELEANLRNLGQEDLAEHAARLARTLEPMRSL